MKATVRIIGVPPADLVAVRTPQTELHAVRVDGNRLQLLTDQCVIGKRTADFVACWRVMRDYARVTDTPVIEGWDELDNHMTYNFVSRR